MDCGLLTRQKLCKHFGICGGCRFQDIAYEQQLRDKERRLADLLQIFGLATEQRPIQYGQPWYYRNKMEFTFASNGKVNCGLYKRNTKRELLDIEECLIFSPDAKLILQAVKDFVRSQGHSAYDKFARRGFLRYLIIREAKFTKQTMIGLVTTDSETLDEKAFVQMLEAIPLQSKLTSIYWVKNNSFSDAVVFEQKRLLCGQPVIIERLADLTFAIGINTFFQVNSSMVVGFYEKIREYIKASPDERVLDLFCGTGSIGIFLAKHAKFVWGVEANKDIVDCAWQNSYNNNIKNISFMVADVRKFLNAQGAFYRDIDILVVNPPRSGLSHKILRSIFRLSPRRILYSCCNPQALVRDLSVLSQRYQLDFVEPFDFFPHTPHLEVCSLLRQKN